jgi:carboxypeptidase C (cathepsin A)
MLCVVIPAPVYTDSAVPARGFAMRRWNAIASGLLLAFAVLAGASRGHAQTAAPPERGRERGAAAAAAPGALPAPVTTQHVLDLPGRSLHFSATAGTIPLTNAQGALQAEIATITYRLDGADPATRPVTFVFNGGPGFSSAWLQLGAIGPWRLPMTGAADAPSAAPVLQPNAETWLDFTDLVFIDPAGTGYSRIVATGDDAKRFWSVSGDIDSLAETIRKWVDRNDRFVSPKFLAGESYGGFRAPRIARVLSATKGIGISGMVLVSPALDLGGHSNAFDPFFWVEHLPTMVAVARALHPELAAAAPPPGAQHAAPTEVTRASLADVEAYAGGDYLLDVARGLADTDAVRRISARVAQLTGLPPDMVLHQAGRISTPVFLREIDRSRDLVGSPYDGTATTPDPYPAAAFDRYADPILEGLKAPFSSAMLALYTDQLNWRTDADYQIENNEAGRQWDYGHGGDRPESMSALRTALALDPHLHVLVECGLFDLVVPYYSTKLLLDTIPRSAGADRVRLAVHPGGHMLYARDDSRAALRTEAQQLIQGE